MTASPFAQGPFLTVAAFCERVLQEGDGVQSMIRIIDRVTRNVARPNAPDELEPFQFPFTYIVIMKAGRARGRHALRLVFEQPNGESRDVLRQDVMFEGDDRGVSVVTQMTMQFELEGLYWMHVQLDDDEVTRSPFRVIYQRRQTAQPPPAPQPPTPQDQDD